MKDTYRKLSFDTNFIFNKIMCDFMKLLHGIYEYNLNSTSILNITNYEEVNNKLNLDGYYVTSIDKNICDKIYKSIQNLIFIDNTSNKFCVFKNFSNNKIQSNTIWIKDPQDILNIAEIQNIIADDKLLYIIQSYFNSKPVFTQVNLWRSINKNKKYYCNAQIYHRDFDNEKSQKIFIYLNNVGIKNGPHVYVKGSKHKIINKHVKRETDDFILENFNKNDIIYHCGKKGTMIIEDTIGYHKGLPVEEGERIILQIEFSINPYSSNYYKKYKLSKIIDKLATKKKLYPYIYRTIKFKQ